MPKAKNSTVATTTKTPKGSKVAKTTKAVTPTKTASVRTKAPSSGRKKGFKKQTVEITDPCIDPFYVICEDRQFIKMQKGSTIPQGYYTSLGDLLRNISKNLLLRKKAGSILTLSQFINEYEQIQSKIISRLDI